MNMIWEDLIRLSLSKKNDQKINFQTQVVPLQQHSESAFLGHHVFTCNKIQIGLFPYIFTFVNKAEDAPFFLKIIFESLLYQRLVYR